MVAIKRSSVPKEELPATVAKLLVVGAKQVGKSAAIVRYTTGRYIQEYNESTSHWLYRHSLTNGRKSAGALNVDCVELLEQRDVQVSRDWTTLQAESSPIDARRATSVPSTNQSLSDRVALDQQLDQRRAEKQEILEKLVWANAYIVVYAINDSTTFNKAIKYLNLIDNNINSSQDSPKPLLATSGIEGAPSTSSSSASTQQCPSSSANSTSRPSSSSGGGGGGGSGSGSGHGCTSSSSNGSITDDLASVGRSFLGMGAGSPPQAASGCSTTAAIHGASGCGCGCSATSSTSGRRPILLLANKCDLEKSQRQVSTSDGRMLAIRHQSMFAEVSVADSHKLLESCLTNLIEQIEPACLHRCQFPGRRRSSAASSSAAGSTTLTEWQPPAIQRLAFTQTGPAAKLAAPIWASLVKCAPLSGIVIQSSSSVIQSRVERTKPQVVATLKRSQQPRYSSSSEPAGCLVPQASKAHKESSYLDRYESLKSSFKTKASLARTLTARHNNVKQEVTPGALKSSSGDIKLPRAEFCEPISGRNKTTSWLRSHIRGSSSSSVNQAARNKQHQSETLSLAQKDGGKDSGESGGRQKRPLFRYKNRRKTVAFEPQEVAENSASAELELSSADPATPNASTSDDAELSRTSDNSPASSLACANDSSYMTGRTGGHLPHQSSSDYSSLEAPAKNNEWAPSIDATGGKQHGLANVSEPSHGELARLSGNQQPETLSVQCDRLGNSQRSSNVGKKRYQLVKSMQATLNNFTKSSSNPTQTQSHTAQPVASGAKRSFCNSLFRYSAPQCSTSESAGLKKVSQPALNLAKVEYIRRESTTVGYCS